MKKQLIKAISFFYKGERHVIKVTSVGKFRVPVTEVVDGNMRTRVKSLTARQMLDHDVVKSCDPTLYLERGEKLRVFQGGDPCYLPAQVQGLVEKHDEANKPRKIPKLSFGSKKAIDNSSKNDYNNYDQAGLWEWPFDDDATD